MRFGSQSEVGKTESILLKQPKEAFINQENLKVHWKELNYTGCQDFEKALKEYEKFESLLKKYIPEFYYLPPNKETTPDSIYVHDPVVITELGVILCNMGKRQREGEPLAAGDFLSNIGIPILGTISGEGKLEGGDLVWIEKRTLAVGLGYRTNEEGIRQLHELITGLIDELVVVPLPYWNGPADVLHLMSFISPIDLDLALVYSRLMPVSFREWLLAKGMKLLEVPDNEFETMACNVLTLAPRKCVMLKGNPQTKKVLEDEGVEVMEYKGEEISFKGQGGPTCLTRPLFRQ